MNNKEVNVIKVSGKSSVKQVAGCICKSIEDNKGVEIHTIGASAINQATKSVAKARGILSQQGYDLYVAPGFYNTIIEGKEVTGIKLIIKIM